MIKVYMPHPNDQVKELLESTGKIKADWHLPRIATTLDEVDAIYFDGGADIQPEYYGERDEHCGLTNPQRDAFEFGIFQRTRRTHYHFGICRGSQLLWVANGGELWQDITGHAIHGTHGINLHGDVKKKRIEGVTSTHHQAARIQPDMKDRVLATERYTAPVKARSESIDTEIVDVIEAHWHPITRSFGVQGHPEFGGASEEYRNYFFDCLLYNERTRIK